MMSETGPESLHSAETLSAAIDIEDLQSSYLYLFYMSLFHPLQTFKVIGRSRLPGGRLVSLAALSVLLISILAPLIDMSVQGGNPTNLVWSLPWSAVLGVAVWGAAGLLISLLGYAFTGKTRISQFLTLSGLATLPWIFMGPVSMLKVGLGPLGALLFVILGLLIWLWSVLLFALALAETYEMSPDRVLVVLAAPFAMSLVLLSWLLGFIDNVRLLALHL